jgi:hypothetical protein
MTARTPAWKEVSTAPAAPQSLIDAADKLVKIGAWDPKGVREWQNVADEARMKCEKIHVGRIFGIAMKNHHEQPATHPDHIQRGRLVFQGNEVEDEYPRDGKHTELSSSPATLEASKNLDANELFPGNSLQRADGGQAHSLVPPDDLRGRVKT